MSLDARLRPHPSRRVVLAAAWAILPLSACGIRLESDAPPFLPAPSPDPAGPAILAERGRVAEIVTALTPARRTPETRLAPVFTAHLAALDRALAALDPPLTPSPTTASVPGADPTGGTAATATAPPTVTPSATLPGPAVGAGLGPSGLARLDDLIPRAAAIVTASHTQRLVASGVLRAAGRPGAIALPAPTWQVAGGDVAGRLVDALRAAAYALEVGAARAPELRPALTVALDLVRRAETGYARHVPDLPPRPLGYRLPGPVTNATQVTRLVDGSLRLLVDAVLAEAVPTAVLLAARPEVTPGPAAPSSPSDGGERPPGAPHAVMSSLVTTAAALETARLGCGGSVRSLPGLGAPTSPTRSSTPSSPGGPSGGGASGGPVPASPTVSRSPTTGG